MFIALSGITNIIVIIIIIILPPLRFLLHVTFDWSLKFCIQMILFRKKRL